MSRRKLKTPVRPEGTRCYCGPFSLMAITGCSFKKAKQVINDINGRRPHLQVKGMWTHELVSALNRFGVKTEERGYKEVTEYGKYITLAKWLNNRKGTDKRAMFLVVVTGHFVVVHGNWFIDTYTKEPVKVDDAPHRRARVKKVIRIY